MSEEIVSVSDLSRRFGRTAALDRVTLTVTRGTVFGLVGENGAGKTTLIRHLLGLQRAQEGSVRTFGLDPASQPVGVLSRIGYLSEERDLPDWMRLGELMSYTRAFYPRWDDRFARDLLAMFELNPSQRVRTLSRGQRARAGLLIASAHRPEFLVLDEPSSGLDPSARLDILATIVRTVADEGRTVLLSSHLLHEVQRVADEVAMLHGGRLLLNEPVGGPSGPAPPADAALPLRPGGPAAVARRDLLVGRGNRVDLSDGRRADRAARGRGGGRCRDCRGTSAVVGRSLPRAAEDRGHRERTAMMIRSASYAISWEYWRRGTYWYVPGCALVVVGCMAPFYAILPDEANVRAYLNHVIFVAIYWAALVMVLVTRNLPRRQYTLPVRTGTLVGCILANGALATAMAYLLVAIGFNILFNAGWPLWGPAWWAVVVYTAFQAAMWSLGHQGGGFLSLALLAVFAVPCLFYQLVPTVSNTGAAPVWPTISALELVISLAVVAGIYRAAVCFVARDRRGDAWSLAWLSPGQWAHHVGDSIPVESMTLNEFTPRSFRSAHAAQFWMEWRSKGRYVPLPVIAALAWLWVIAIVNRLDVHMVSAAWQSLTSTLLLTSPVVGVYLGHRSERFDIKPFLATRPLSDTDLAMIVLRHSAMVCGVTAILWLIGVAFTVAVWGPPPESLPTTYDATAHLLLKASIAVLAFGGLVWTIVGLGAALAMARSWFVPVGWFGAFALFLVVVCAMPLAGWAVMFLPAAGCLGATVAAFACAWQRNLVSSRTVVSVLTVYVFFQVCLLLGLGEGILSLEVFLPMVGFSAAPLAPLAVAPLALAWNRHR